MLVDAIEIEDPTILNSNLLPVKAKGLVLFLSVASFVSEGIESTPKFKISPFLLVLALPVLIIWSTISDTWSPR